MPKSNQLYLIEELQNLGTAARENRQRVANIVLANQNLFKELIDIIFFVDNKVSIKAGVLFRWRNCDRRRQKEEE